MNVGDCAEFADIEASVPGASSTLARWLFVAFVRR